MNAAQAEAAVAAAISTIAPDVDLSSVDRGLPFRRELDLDSLDFLNLVQTLHDATGIDIAETDYARIDTLAHLVDYLTSHAPSRA